MKLTDVISKLAYGKLSNHSMAEAADGTIAMHYHPKIVDCINEGLMRLHSRFILQEKELILELVESITQYHLLPKYGESNQPQPDVEFPYIKDLHCEPFAGDIIRVLRVFDSYGSQLPLNDTEACNAVFTPHANVLQAMPLRSGDILSVQYQAKHATLSHQNEEEEVILPDFLYPALYSYVAFMVYSDMGSQDSLVRADGYYQMYESICQEAETRDLLNTSVANTNIRFHKRGWV